MARPDRGCPRESDVVEALQNAAWPDCCRVELRAHVAACASCQEVVNLAGALIDERTVAMAEARVPAAATMWWRVQLRARREAERRALQPISVLQLLAAASGAGALAAGAAMVSPTVRRFAAWVLDGVGGVMGLGGTAATSAASVGWSSTVVGVSLGLTLALVLVVVPLAAVWMLRDE